MVHARSSLISTTVEIHNMIELCEFSIKAHIEYNELRALLADTLRIDRSQIVAESEFWNCIENGPGTAVGLGVFHSNAGFRTLCKWYQARDFREAEFLTSAITASLMFNSEVAIGNFIDSPDGSADQFIVITPAKQFYRAYSLMNTDAFDTIPVDGNLYDVESLINQDWEKRSG